MKPIGASIFVVYFLMIFPSLVRFYVFVMPPGGSKMMAVDVSIGPYQWLGRLPSYHEVLTPVQLLLRLQNHHHHTQAATTTTTTTTLQSSLAMDQEEKKQVQSIRDQLKGHSLPDGGEIVGSVNLSSSEFTATNNRAHIVRRYESGSTASEKKTTRETSDRKGITFSLFSLEDLRQYFVCKLINAVSVCILLAIYLLCSKVSQPVRSSTQPSASQQVEIVEGILLSLSDFAATIDNSPYEPIIYQGIFRSYEKTRKPPKPEPAPPLKAPEKPKEPPPPPPKALEIPKQPEELKLQPRSGQIKVKVFSENLQQYFGRKRKDVAASLGVSVSTFKRMCRLQGITRWQNQMGSSGSVSIPLDQHGERNTSTARETPSHNVQTRIEGVLVGQNQEANEFRRDFTEGSIPLNTGNGLIIGSSFGWASQVNGQSTLSTPYPNHDALGFPPPEITSMPSENRGASIDLRNFLDPIDCKERENAGSSFGWASQVNGQSTLSTPYPNHDALGFPPPQITSMPSENRGASIDLRNSLASQAEPFSDRHISRFSNLTFATCSDQAASSQHVGGQAMQSTDHNAFVFPQTQMVSPQKPFPAGHVFEFSNWNKDTNSAKIIIKAFYGEHTIYKFRFPLTSGIDDLKKEVSKRLNVEVDRFEVKYMDEYEHFISLPCDEDWMLCLESSRGNDEIRVYVFDKVC